MSRPLAIAIRLAFIALLAALPYLVDTFWLNMLILALIYSLVVFSINVLTGFAGLLSFGQAGFVGAGAYTYGVLTVGGTSPGLAALAGIALPTVLGFLLGLPAARLKGHYLAIGTLGFGVLMAQLLNNMVDVTRGPMGLLGIKSIGLSRTEWYYLLLAFALVVMAGLTLLERRAFLGVVMKSVKYDEVSAAASGIGTFGVKLFVFSASAFLAGWCGIMLAAYMRFLTPDLFVPAESFRYLMMAVVGGGASPIGGLIAALGLTAVPELLRNLGETNVRLLIYGTMVLFVLWFVPGGIGGLIDRYLGLRRPDIRSLAEPAERTAQFFPGSPGALGTTVLEVKNISKHFGGVKALQAVSLTGLAGEIHGLIGPNGAGKSTLIGCVTGVNRIDQGEIVFRGRRIDRLSVHMRSRLGIGRTFQKIRLAQQLTVYENVAAGLAARWLQHWSGFLRLLTLLSSQRVAGPVLAALEAAGIADIAAEEVSSLPYGKRHFVELARALVAEPQVLLLDEPATGLTEFERVSLMTLVRQVAANGTLVILVEHDLDLVGRLCDRVTVIEYGRCIFSGTPGEAQHNPDVVRAYLGSAKFAPEEMSHAQTA